MVEINFYTDLLKQKMNLKETKPSSSARYSNIEIISVSVNMFSKEIYSMSKGPIISHISIFESSKESNDELVVILGYDDDNKLVEQYLIDTSKSKGISIYTTTQIKCSEKIKMNKQEELKC